MKIFGYGDANWIKLIQTLDNKIPECPQTFLKGLMKATLKLWTNDCLVRT